MSLYDEKKQFLRYELGVLSLKAALSTRSGTAPIYAKSCSEQERSRVKETLREELQKIDSNYSNGRVSEPDHCAYIESLANRITESHSTYLFNGRFRFGVAQKLTNIHLKYLWVAGLIEEPPHCPIDGIIRDLASLSYDWIENDSKLDYESAIANLKKHAQSQSQSLSAWELKNFKRRAQSEA